MTEATTPRKLTVIGASYVQQWGQPPLPGYVVTNKGVGGEESTHLRERFDRDVLAARPDAVVIWGHYNDIVRAPNGDYAGAKQRAKDNLRDMHLRASAAGIRVFLATEVTLPESMGVLDSMRSWLNSLRGKTDYRVRVNGHIKEVNAWLRQYAADSRVPLLDLEKAVDTGDGYRDPEYTSEDGSHISPAGYAVITTYVASAVR